jgi:hypothetical protein
MSKVYCYSRVSTDKQDNSMEVQYKKLQEFCNRKGFTDAIYLADTDVSGGKALFNRPEGSKLKSLQRGDVLIVCKSDRLYRSFRNAVNQTIDLVDAGVQLYIIDFNENAISFESPMLEVMLYQTFIFAHMERRMIGQRTKDGLSNRRLNGQTNSAPKMGYDNVYEMIDGKEVGKEVPNEKEQQTLLRANELRKKMSAYKVATKLNNEALYTKNGFEWKGSNIDTILDRAYKNGVFLGVKYWRDAR